METKKWPMMAQVLIGLGCIGGLMTIMAGLSKQNILQIVFGITFLLVFWNVYRFKSWALTGLTVFLSLDIVFIVLGIITGGVPVVPGVVVIGIKGLVLYYFNSRPVKALFVGRDSLNHE